MIIVLIFIAIGAVIGFIVPFQFFAVSSFYVSVGILAAIDSIIGALKASYDDDFDPVIFVSGLFINMLMAMALSWVGDRLGVPLYYAAIFVFGTRLFNNLALIRRRMIERYRMRVRVERERKQREEQLRDFVSKGEFSDVEIGMGSAGEKAPGADPEEEHEDRSTISRTDGFDMMKTEELFKTQAQIDEDLAGEKADA